MSIKCFFTGHEFTNSTGLFSKTPYCLKCGKSAFANTINKDALDTHEEEICHFITGDDRICRKETVKAMVDYLRELSGETGISDGR